MLTPSFAQALASSAPPHLLNWDPKSQLANFRGARGMVRSGQVGARCPIACYGDSTTAGWNGSNVLRAFTSMPAKLVKNLTAYGAPATIGNFAGNGNYNTGDTRIVDVGTGGWGGPNVFGGQTKQATGSANGFDFSPGVTFDRVDVDFVDTAAANTFTVFVDGGTAQTVTPTNSGTIKSITLTLSGTPSSVVSYRGGTTQTQIQGFRCWSSANPNIEVYNGGRGTMDTQGGANVPTGNTPFAGLLAVKPKLTLINFGINDANNGVSGPNYQTNMTAMVTALQGINCDVILCLPTAINNSAASQNTLVTTYLAALLAIGAAKNVPIINWQDRYGVWSKANTQFGQGDNLHPSTPMYDDQGSYLARLLIDI